MNAPTDRWEPYRVITDEVALLEACIDRAEDLNISRITIDEAGGFTPGYSAKLLCNPPIKTMVNSSLSKMLKALGLALVVVVDDERFAGTKAQLSKRKKRMRPVARIRRVKGFFTKENAAKYSQKRWNGVPDDVKSNLMRKVANARWRKRRREARARGASLIQPDAASCGHDQPTSNARAACCPQV